MELSERIAEVQSRMRAAADRAGRDPDAVTLLAVSKRHSADVVRAGLSAGLIDFGENFAQELVAKMKEVADDAVRWHFIGRLQRNKAKLVVGRAALVHAVDSAKLAVAIDKHAQALDVVQAILIAVNIADEASKSGVAPDAVADLVRDVDLPGLRCEGFMAMPPLVENPDDNRRHFAALRELRDRLATQARPLATLSMGTTADYEVAIGEGATLVRVGTAIFGPRPN